MEELSMHILDIAENSTRAGARLIGVTITESKKRDQLTIEIEDDGIGMDEETLNKALDPFYTTKTVRRIGLGLPLISQAARDTGGTFTIESNKGKGTHVAATFGYSHIDRQPLGRMADTMATLIAGCPDIDFLYIHRTDGGSFSIDTREIRETLEAVPINHSEVLHFIRQSIHEGLEDIEAGS